MRSGTLSSLRLKNYHRLVRELAFEQGKAKIGVARSERKRWKGITKLAKEFKKGMVDFNRPELPSALAVNGRVSAVPWLRKREP